MKFKKTLGAVFAAAIVAASFAGCGETPSTPNNNNDPQVSQVGQSAANMTSTEILRAAQNASTKSQAQAQAMQAKMNAVMKMSATDNGQTASINMNLDADIIAKEDPLAMAMNMTLDMEAAGQKQSQDVSMYALEEDGKCAMYIGTGGQWQKQVVELDSEELQELKEQSSESFNTDAFTDSFLADSQMLENKGIRKINGKDAVVLEGEISASEMADALKSAGIEDQLRQLNLTLDDIQTKSGIKVTACYDAETYMPLQMDIDMTDFFSEMVQSMMKSSLNTTGASMDVQQYTMTLEVTAYGKDVPDIVLPAAAASAATV